MSKIVLLLVVLCAAYTVAEDNGLAVTPPMGWRSWNCFHADVDQNAMQQTMDAMVARWLTVDGVPTSLKDLGYTDCGLDDNWQACGTGVDNSFHDANGNPLVNTKTFPSMSAMTAYGHARGLTVGWYGNNCICSEHNFPNVTGHMQGDVNALVRYGFDGIKLDGCGEFTNLTWWSDLINATGKPMLIENCHWGQTVPTLDWCPFNFFRTSGDIGPSWSSWFGNLQTVLPYSDYDQPLSRPGCWNYPDMLEVGNLPTFEENRAHFGAWCIVSSPLVLGFDLRDNQTYQAMWPIISNREAIAVNQQWVGHPAQLVRSWNPSNTTAGNYVWGVPCDASDATQRGWAYNSQNKSITAQGMCVDSSSENELMLKPCHGATSQQFNYNSNKEFTSVTDNKCIDVYDFSGPVVQMYPCNGGTNEEFTIQSGGVIQTQDNHCLAYRSSPPGQGGIMQLWAKPQPQGSVAVLIINSDLPPNGNHTVTFDFKSLNLTSTGTYMVRDIWNRKNISTAQNSFTTDLIPGHDSRFYLLIPQ